MVRKKGHWVTLVGLLIAVCGTLHAAEPSEVPVHFSIRAPTLVAALMQFSQQARVQLFVPVNNDTEQNAPRLVEGVYTPKGALEVLLKDSGLTYTFVNDRTVSISPAKTSSQESLAAIPTRR